MARVNLIDRLDWSLIRDNVVQEMEAIDSVVKVHNRLRFDQFSQEERFKKLFTPQGSSRINAWTIQRLARTTEFDTNREYEVTTTVGLDFWYQVDDRQDTQAIFDQIIDDVFFQFQEPIRLDCTAELQGPMQLVEEDHRYFATELVHHAEMQTLVKHRVFQNSFR